MSGGKLAPEIVLRLAALRLHFGAVVVDHADRSCKLYVGSLTKSVYLTQLNSLRALSLDLRWSYLNLT